MEITISVHWLFAFILIGAALFLAFKFLDNSNDPGGELFILIFALFLSFWKPIVTLLALGILFLGLEAFNIINFIE